MNKTLLTGRLTRDAELLEFNNGKRKAIKFTLAVDRKYKSTDGEKLTDFIPVTYFANHADKLLNYLTKGRLISVSGRISTSSAQGEDGNKHYYTNITADSIDFLDSQKNKAL